MCIHYLFHGSSIVKLALLLSSHSPILMNMMLYAYTGRKESSEELEDGLEQKGKDRELGH